MAKNNAQPSPEGGTDSVTSADTDAVSSGAAQGVDAAATNQANQEAAEASGPALRSRKRDLATTEEKFSLVTFAKGTKEELSKIVWPTRQQLISESAAVLLMVSLSATVVYLVDNLFSWAARQVFG